MSDPNTKQPVYTVSKLTSEIKTLLEEAFPFIWITGEVSNFSMPSSGHYYFTLKDEHAQINAVMFRSQNRNLKFSPEDGISITGFGRISVYEPRGTYQIIFEYLEPKGVGALQLAFEQLKTRLSSEGLFDPAHKKTLPFLPKKISLITSPTGAVVYDILKIIERRFPNVHIEIIPVKVQGNDAEKEIVAGLEYLNSRSDADVAILARGGGSLEDFSAFNSERVAKAIFLSKIPIISAVGHETDFTIADFVSDLRAPTPSAAAELVVPLKKDLEQKCYEISISLTSLFYRYIEHLRLLIQKVSIRLVDPKKKIQDLRLRIDDFTTRLFRRTVKGLNQSRERLTWRIDRLFAGKPLSRIMIIHDKLDQTKSNLLFFFKLHISQKTFLLRELTAQLHALSPAAILDRGYSITRTIPDAVIVRDPNAVNLGQNIEVMVAKGSLTCRIEGKTSHGEKNV